MASCGLYRDGGLAPPRRKWVVGYDAGEGAGQELHAEQALRGQRSDQFTQPDGKSGALGVGECGKDASMPFLPGTPHVGPGRFDFFIAADSCGKTVALVLSQQITMPGTATATPLPAPSVTTVADGYTLTLSGDQVTLCRSQRCWQRMVIGGCSCRLRRPECCTPRR